MLARLLDYTLDPSLRCTEPARVQLPPPAASRLWSSLSAGLGHALGLLAGDY